MTLEILENKKPATKFNINDTISGYGYEFDIAVIRECHNQAFIRCKPIKINACDECDVQLVYISASSGVAYCSRYPFKKIKMR